METPELEPQGFVPEPGLEVVVFSGDNGERFWAWPHQLPLHNMKGIREVGRWRVYADVPDSTDPWVQSVVDYVKTLI